VHCSPSLSRGKERELVLLYLGRREIKIYTGSGDRGNTSLFSGERLSKDHDRVEAYGDVDELNSVLGALVALLPKEKTELVEEIQRIQSDLLHVGAWLATTPDSPALADLEEITEEWVGALEMGIDRMEKDLPGLREFILPGGHISASWAHVARTVCRRAERHVVRLSDRSGEGERAGQLRGVLVFLNRLSDYLFVVARYCNQIMGVPDILWNK
jgi:cob(I)alamin adenosyltransferase